MTQNHVNSNNYLCHDYYFQTEKLALAEHCLSQSCHTLLHRRNVYFYIIEGRKLQFKIQSIFANVWIADKPNNKTRTFTCFSPGSEIVLLLILVCYLNSMYGLAENGYYLSNRKQRREDNEEDSRAT